ncbi:hypothetical protein QN382_18565 [Pseudomonas sp. 10B1]|uniref:hypothetical protein n=1 Tax=unclassified Pseudomonas TaxID=196821 RepID=UPI002B22C3AC|nr:MULTISPECIES: hypothetical protein [unclassified Pseudomonas]MEA9996730.1 hypothetical protein [Pseudomonas sp. AA4]MEB0085470.1 hypothetical protein [Pseudomonas sp. RTI1]MEB0124532.1 hypothetical protein [Pseudomonas sp. CCC1.2]MEB0152321.1 hypothetical protein [Pseudomonas sp. CCC4.3]MEB0219310.1 hypothetical protein [Pseudomonas sp. AB12(2023)]
MTYYRTPLDVTTLPAWHALTEHRKTMKNFSMREAFSADPQRFNEFTLSTSVVVTAVKSTPTVCVEHKIYGGVTS